MENETHTKKLGPESGRVMANMGKETSQLGGEEIAGSD